MQEDKIRAWELFEETLIQQRYSIRAKNGERLERTFEDVANRVSDYLDRIDFPVGKTPIREGLELFRARKLTFATPVLMCMGNPYTRRRGYYSCYPLGPVPDHTAGILAYVDLCARVFQFAGGVGLDFSQLRAKGAPVDNHQGESSGPCGFIPLFEAVAKSIAAGGKRRGAMLIQLDWDHPDVFSFVKIKRDQDLPSVNISVNVTSDKFWEQKDLLEEIAKSIWISGDPGLLFINNAMELSPYPEPLKQEARYVNPCVTGDTLVATEYGEIPIAELAERFQRGEKIRVLNANGNYTVPLRVWKTRENVRVVRVVLSDGHEVKTTPDHAFYVTTRDGFLKLHRMWAEEGRVDLSAIDLKRKKAVELTPDDYLIPRTMIRADAPTSEIEYSKEDCRALRVEPVEGLRDVYNITEPETHKVFYNGVLSANCGEYVAPAFSVCNLLTGNARVMESFNDFEELGYYMTHLGNAVLWITITRDGEGLPPLPDYYTYSHSFYERVSSIRPVGIGLTGVAEFLLKKGYTYSDISVIDEIYCALARGSLKASAEWCEATKEEAEWDNRYKERHLSRINYSGPSHFWNTTTISQAPTGSTSQFLRCLSTGIAPLEDTEVERMYVDASGTFKSVKLSTLIDVDEIPKATVDDQLNMIATVQEISHTSASNTINLPSEVTPEDVLDIIHRAKEYKLKGLTLFRYGSRLEAVVKPKSSDQKGNEDFDVRRGITYKFRSRTNVYVTVNLDDKEKPCEVFVTSGKSGSIVNGLTTGMGRLISLALRAGTPVDVIVDALRDIETGELYHNSQVGVARSICDAVAQVLSQFAKENEMANAVFDLCPNCHRFTLVRTGGCKSCTSCGYTTC